jgi:hypothetical protein
MVGNYALITVAFILMATSLAIAYGLGVQARWLPFSADIGFDEQQLIFLKWWVRLALAAGVLLPIALWIYGRGQADVSTFWKGYLLVVAVQLLSEYRFSQLFVPSVVVPIGFCYTAFRLWQLLDGFNQLSLPYPALAGFAGVAIFWLANLVMLITLALPTIYQGQQAQE